MNQDSVLLSILTLLAIVSYVKEYDSFLFMLIILIAGLLLRRQVK